MPSYPLSHMLAGRAAPAATPAATSTSSSCATLSLKPQTVNFTFYAGDDARPNLILTNPDGTPVDLTGATVTAQIRATPADNTIAASFAVTVADNVISLWLNHTDSAALTGSLVWDCQIAAADGDITTIAAGKITMLAEVTRP